jgi:hypothetical protein
VVAGSGGPHCKSLHMDCACAKALSDAAMFAESRVAGSAGHVNVAADPGAVTANVPTHASCAKPLTGATRMKRNGVRNHSA